MKKTAHGLVASDLDEMGKPDVHCAEQHPEQTLRSTSEDATYTEASRLRRLQQLRSGMCTPEWSNLPPRENRRFLHAKDDLLGWLLPDPLCQPIAYGVPMRDPSLSPTGRPHGRSPFLLPLR